MLSEELLKDLGSIDSETTLEELLAIAEDHNKGNSDDYDTWGYLADAAFLANYHRKPRAFKQIIEMILAVFAGFQAVELTAGRVMNEALRAIVLICSDDAPTDPQIVAYIIGHLKGVLRIYRKIYEEDLDEVQRGKVKPWIACRLHNHNITDGSVLALLFRS
jgi:hypothetical protein